MGVIEEISLESRGIEHSFREKKVLFIGSESHDAPTITVLQGLQDLGFTIYTIGKWNINSWFCNVVIDDPSSLSFDFILSNLHWGTRWEYYSRYRLDSFPRVLIDGDDNRHWKTWRDKYHYYRTTYLRDPPEEIKNRKVSDVRWVEELGSYSPDIVFTAQKQTGDHSTHYLPFGIQREFLAMRQGKSTTERSFDLVHIDGPGRKRLVTRHALNSMKKLGVLPGTMFNGYAHGDTVIAPDIERFYEKERSSKNVVHAYFRWAVDRTYFNILNDAKVFVYPGVDRFPFWESKRPWEAYASGCFVMLSKPSIDTSEYPPMELCEFATYSSLFELLDKYRYLNKNSHILDAMRTRMEALAAEYFSPVPLARYVLLRIQQVL